LKLADYTVTEAGFGADLGAEKFFDIKCRAGGLTPACAVLVVTRRAFALHGLANVRRHVENLRLFGVPVLVSINRFRDDTPAELAEIEAACRELDVPAVVTDYRESGGSGGLALAEAVCAACETPSAFRVLYELAEACATRSRRSPRASTVPGRWSIRPPRGRAAAHRGPRLPRAAICMAKTPASLSDNPKLSGSPAGFELNVTSAKVSAGAGFVVVYTGAIMTMPGLPRQPAALAIDVDAGRQRQRAVLRLDLTVESRCITRAPGAGRSPPSTRSS